DNRTFFQTTAEGEAAAEEDAQTDTIPGWVSVLSRIIVGGSITIAVLVGIAMLFYKYRRREGPAGVRESTYQEGRLSADIGDLFGSLLGRLRPSIHIGGQGDPARRLYFDMVH